MRTPRRSVAAATLLAISAGAAGCSSDDVTNTSADRAALADPFEREKAQEVVIDGFVGLEVTAVGDVEEVLSEEALRIDRDGVGSFQDAGQERGRLGYDFDYYNHGALVEHDEEFEDDDAADQGVLVVDATGLPTFKEGEEIRLSGTVRRLDLDQIESAYDIGLADGVLAEYQDSWSSWRTASPGSRPSGKAQATGTPVRPPPASASPDLGSSRGLVVDIPPAPEGRGAAPIR